MEIRYSSRFKKDYKKVRSDSKLLETLRLVISILASENELPEIYRDHKLIGNWAGHRECHLKPDCLLIYRKTTDMLELVRVGSHSELFS